MVSFTDIKGRHTKWIALGLAAMVGLIVASVMVWIAFQENSQREFFDPITGVVDWAYALALFGSWFAVVSVPISAAAWGGIALHARIRRQKLR